MCVRVSATLAAFPFISTSPPLSLPGDWTLTRDSRSVGGWKQTQMDQAFSLLFHHLTAASTWRPKKKNPQRSEFGHILVCTWSWGLRAPPLRADQLKLTARLKIADCATSKPWNQAAAPCMGILWSSKKWKKLREIPRMSQTSVTGFHPKAQNSVSSTPNHSCLQENYCKCSWFIWYHVAKKAHCAVFAFARISLFVC